MADMTQYATPTRVLVMDQDAKCPEQLLSVLQSQAIETKVVCTTQDAIDELRFSNYAALLFNDDDDDGDGQQTLLFLQKARACAPQVQIVWLIEPSNIQIPEDSILQGGFTCVKKKDSCDELITAIYQAVHRYHARALHRLQMRFETLVDDLSDQVVRYLPDGTITFANRAFLESFNLKPMDYKGRLVFEFIEMSERKIISNLWEQFTPRNTVLTLDVLMLMPTGLSVKCRWTNRAIYDSEDQLEEIQSAICEITRGAHSQEDMRLFDGEKLNTVSEMVSSFAHELNQPLAAIANYNQGCIKRLERLPDIPAAILDALQASSEQSARAREIVRRLRDLVEKREGENEPNE
ncbi:MAG: hypothetical protein JKX85_09055 [Phycisphaeraceae bacterium]|nr:hypothetical protein [Phycisphaeraceae bacterium]